MNNTWLVFSPSLTARQQALRVKVWRRLSTIGAVPLKNSLHLLPEREDCREHLSWLAQEVEAGGGDAVVLTCVSLGGLSDAEARSLFRRARDGDYAEVEQETAEVSARLVAEPGSDIAQREAKAFLRRAERRLAAIRDIDFFPSGRGDALAVALEDLGRRLDGRGQIAAAPPCLAQDFLGRTWVTRARPYIDRLSSFWLVRRAIDPAAQLRFLAPGEDIPRGDAFASFDMVGADFTHRGELVTFEVLVRDFGIDDPAVRRLLPVIRAIDLASDLLDETGEGEGYERGLPAEARAVKHVLDGLVKISRNDAELLERALVLFDALAASYTPGGSDEGH
jgi:hypothetical protein